MNPVYVESPRVDHTLHHNSVIPLNPHPAEANVPHVPQGMAGLNLFDTFEEEHMETPSLLRYKTRARARQHSANQDQCLAPHVFQPITFTSTQGFHVAPKQATNHIIMANASINKDTGASLEYRQLKQDETTLPVWNKAAANKFGRLAQGDGGGLNPTRSSLSHARQYPKGKL
jgi:hypothetical protein